MLGTTSTTRSIEIDIPVERVFAFLADPVKSVQAFPMGRNGTVSDIATSPGGRHELPGDHAHAARPIALDWSDTVGVEEYVANERIVDRWSTGPIHVMIVEPSGNGTQLTFTGTVSTRIPLLDKVKVLVLTQGRGQARNMDMVLAQVKKLVEAET